MGSGPSTPPGRESSSLRHLEGLTWTLGYDNRRRKALKALRLTIRKQRQLTNDEADRQRNVGECEIRPSEVIKAIYAVQLGWSPVIPIVTRVLDPTVPLRIVVIDFIDGDGFAKRLAEAPDATTRMAVVGIAATAHDGLRLVDELFAVLVAGASAYVAHDVHNTRLVDRIRRSAMGDYPITDLLA